MWSQNIQIEGVTTTPNAEDITTHQNKFSVPNQVMGEVCLLVLLLHHDCHHFAWLCDAPYHFGRLQASSDLALDSDENPKSVL